MNFLMLLALLPASRYERTLTLAALMVPFSFLCVSLCHGHFRSHEIQNSPIQKSSLELGMTIFEVWKRMTSLTMKIVKISILKHAVRKEGHDIKGTHAPYITVKVLPSVLISWSDFVIRKTMNTTTATEEIAVQRADGPAQPASDLGQENEQQEQHQQQRPPSMTTPAASSRVGLFTRYLKFMDRQPLLGKSLTAAIIGALGSALGSYLASKSKGTSAALKSKQRQVSIDWLDVFSFAIYGGFVGGPLGQYWYVLRVQALPQVWHKHFSCFTKCLLCAYLLPPLFLLLLLRQGRVAKGARTRFSIQSHVTGSIAGTATPFATHVSRFGFDPRRLARITRVVESLGFAPSSLVRRGTELAGLAHCHVSGAWHLQ
jgi:hypothetical protein